MTNKSVVQSACECQGQLGAELNEARHVLRGWVKDPRRRKEHAAPCHSINAAAEYFQLAWLCPLCGRNTLRSFHTGSLSFREQGQESAEAAAWNVG